MADVDEHLYLFLVNSLLLFLEGHLESVVLAVCHQQECAARNSHHQESDAEDKPSGKIPWLLDLDGSYLYRLRPVSVSLGA